MNRPCLRTSRSVAFAALGIIGLGALALAPIVARAQLVGSQVQGRYLYPNTTSVIASAGPTTIANGTTLNFENFLSVTFADTRITFTNLTIGSFTAAPFNGIDLTFLSGPTLTGVTLDPTSSSLFATGSVLNFTGNDIRLNLAGTCAMCTGHEQIVLDVNTSSTTAPEPGSLALLATGLVGLVPVARRKLKR
jgi:hypothetical protein